jgi:sensor histidine kinase YesM
MLLMQWITYIGITIIAYLIILVKLKVKTHREKVKEAYIFWCFLIFFIIFEFVFLESFFKSFLFHILGLCLSFIYALTIYIYLRSIKKDIDTIFYKLLEQSRGRISILTFMQATELPAKEAQDYLNKKIRELRGNRRSTRGNIYYEFSIWQ